MSGPVGTRSWYADFWCRLCREDTEHDFIQDHTIFAYCNTCDTETEIDDPDVLG